MTSPVLFNNTTDSRYELKEGETVVGFVQYRIADDKIVLVHTEILPGNEGKGYGSRIAKLVLEQIQTAGKPMVPLCEFMAGYIAKHPEYEKLVSRETGV
jgi:predicted GNAT family acetyltransferase